MTDDVLAREGGALAAPGPWTPRRVVVGVDGTAANDTAVCWAAAEARRADCPLLLLAVSAADTPTAAPRSENLEREHIQRLARDMLESVRDRLRGSDLEVQIAVVSGEPSRALVRSTDAGDLVVVGKRGRHPLARTVLGSTSIATVGRTQGPVVVVPEHWAANEHEGEPIVVGFCDRTDDAVLRTAFTRAAALSVGLTVVRSWDLPAAYGRSPDDVVELDKSEQEGLDAALTPWRRRFADVVVRDRCEPLAAPVALLGEAVAAQLLVLGRRTKASHPGGLSLGSTTRRVLHHAHCPVLVVPIVPGVSHTPDDTFDETDEPEF